MPMQVKFIDGPAADTTIVIPDLSASFVVEHPDATAQVFIGESPVSMGTYSYKFRISNDPDIPVEAFIVCDDHPEGCTLR